MTNKKFNIILIGIGAILLIILFNVFYLYNRNEESKVNFNHRDIKETSWIRDDIRLEFKDKNVLFKLGDETIINSEYILDNKSGKLELETEQELYLRSVNEYSIIIWYNQALYNLEKEIIAR